jgi:hypothetical protein
MPTLLEAAGIDAAKQVGPLDGTSLVGLLAGRHPRGAAAVLAFPELHLPGRPPRWRRA